jgi:phospholipid/cholesterol/gamma-HCH transport system substrate-binding protein
MKISNEAKVGILAIAAILSLIIGFNFLKNSSVFSKQPAYYAVFKNLGGLQVSNEVRINGLPVGKVHALAPVDKEVNGIMVEIHMSRDIRIPKGSVAFIDGSLVGIGSSYITISKSDANVYHKVGDTLTTRLDSGVIEDLKTQMKPTMTRVNETLDSLKMAIGAISSIFDPRTNGNLQTLIARLTITSAHLEQLLNAQSGALAHSLDNLNSVTGNLAKNNDAISSSIRNVEVTTGNLANARIKEAVTALEGTINELKSTAGGLRTSIDKINSPDGTLGALMNDRKLYNQLNSAALSLEILLDDMRMHPKRYVNISVFGGKGKPDPITAPARKDSIPR